MKLAVLLCGFAIAAHAESLLPPNWDPALAGDEVMERLANTSASHVKGAHDAEFVCVGERAYIVTEANDVKAGESAVYSPSEPGFWRRELLDAKYAGLQFLMLNTYGPDIEDGKLAPKRSDSVRRTSFLAHFMLSALYWSED